jgi:hypothetical protein
MAACEGYIYGLGANAGNVGAPTVQSFTPDRAQRTSDAHARFQNAVQQGNVYGACNTAAVTFGTALTATAVTFTLYNPLGSGVSLVLWRVSLAVAAASTAGSIVYAINNNIAAAIPSTVTAITGGPKNCLVGSPKAAQGLAYSVATLPATPLALKAFAFVPVTATAGTGNIEDPLDGMIILQPNCAVTMQGITCVGTGIFSCIWEEVPVQL